MLCHFISNKEEVLVETIQEEMLLGDTSQDQGGQGVTDVQEE